MSNEEKDLVLRFSGVALASLRKIAERRGYSSWGEPESAEIALELSLIDSLLLTRIVEGGGRILLKRPDGTVEEVKI